ncbi:LEPR-XLL domain-containing protein [Streptomyces cavernae]|uniref:LEPR-XLL domain-containing protein n=1 Tax=Streptomyces cavernae TaxID=2259034 RepID=UPI003B75BAF5
MRAERRVLLSADPGPAHDGPADLCLLRRAGGHRDRPRRPGTRRAAVHGRRTGHHA